MHWLAKERARDIDETAATVIARALAKSRGVSFPDNNIFAPDSVQDEIYTEAIRAVAALRKWDRDGTPLILKSES